MTEISLADSRSAKMPQVPLHESGDVSTGENHHEVFVILMIAFAVGRATWDTLCGADNRVCVLSVRIACPTLRHRLQGIR
jgi:hypothetical protein